MICYSETVRKTPEEEINFKKRACIFTWDFTLGQFPVPACANKPPVFSVRGTSSPNGLFQTTRMLMDYTRQIHQLKYGVTAQKMKFSIKDFFSKCDQIHGKLRFWSNLLKKSFIENFIFCAVYTVPFKIRKSWTFC